MWRRRGRGAVGASITVESLPVEHVTGRLKLLYKGKGGNRVLDDWRGIMLLEPAAKIVSAIIARRLAPFVIQEDQCGFRALPLLVQACCAETAGASAGLFCAVH